MGQGASHNGVLGSAADGFESVVRPGSLPMDRVKNPSRHALLAARYHNVLQGGKHLIYDYNVVGQVIGNGSCGEVVLVHRHVDQGRYAMKTMRKGQFHSTKRLHLTSEVEVYLGLDHPNICRLHDAYESMDAVHLVMRYCAGGELFTRLQKKGVFGNHDALQTVRQMLRAVGYLHSQHVVHRDIKLENFVFETLDPTSNLKLIDFGLAMHWDKSRPITGQCGSLMYMSPDVLCGEGYTDKCDLWSVGVITWMLLTGHPPFRGSEEVIMQKINAGLPDWNVEGWEFVSKNAFHFVECLLNKDPALRPNAQEAFWLPWLVEGADTGGCALTGSMLRSLRHYVEGPALRRMLLHFVAHELRSEDTVELQRTFLALDRTNRGTICVAELREAARNAKLQKPAQAPQHGCRCADSGPPSKAGEDEHPAQQLSQACSDVIDRLLEKIQFLGDVRISYLEFLAAAMESLPCVHEGALQAAFNRLKADGSGTITAASFNNAVGDNFNESNIEELMNAADSSCHGVLEYESFVRILGLGCEVVEANHSSAKIPQEETRKIQRVQLAHCSPMLFVHDMWVNVLDWTLDLISPNASPGILGNNAVALFGVPIPKACPAI